MTSTADVVVLEQALSAVAHLGRGGEGPWENRTHRVVAARRAGVISYPVAAGWINAEHSVQLLRHATHPGIDHLLIRRHDQGTDIPWPVLQAIKDRLAPDGQRRWAIEAFPPPVAVDVVLHVQAYTEAPP